MLWPSVLAVLAEVPPHTTGGEASTGYTGVVVSAVAVIVAGAIAAFITGFFSTHKSRRWRQEQVTDDKVGKRLGRLETETTAREVAVAEWRGNHDKATNEWVGETNQLLRDIQKALKAVEDYLHRLGWGGGDDV